MAAILRCYEVTAITKRDGLIEYLNGFVSLHELKKHIQSQGFDLLGVRFSLGANLQEYIRYSFEGKPQAFQRFRRNFIYSLAAFSIVCYVLQIKDRNDGNVAAWCVRHRVDPPGQARHSGPHRLRIHALELSGQHSL